MGSKKISLKYRDTYVYIDVSNIRLACEKTLGVGIDFARLLGYFKRKYPNLKDVRYYEGIADDNAMKRKMFSYLALQGYTVCGLERKSYRFAETNRYKVRCPKCNNVWKADLTKWRKTVKSNVDVYLASDMMTQAALAQRPTRLILVTCDGDYAEAIKNAISLSKNIVVSVLATPFVSRNNTLSTRLRDLLYELPKSRYALHDISNIVDQIKDMR